MTSRTPSRPPRPCGSPAWPAPRSASRSCSPAPSALRCSSRSGLIGAPPSAPSPWCSPRAGWPRPRPSSAPRSTGPGSPRYLGFHLRRVDAAVDPNVRGTVEAAEQRAPRPATAAWVELVGADDRRPPRQGARGRGAGVQRRAAQPRRGRRRDRAAPQGAGRRAEPAVADARAALAHGLRALRARPSDDLADPLERRRRRSPPPSSGARAARTPGRAGGGRGARAATAAQRSATSCCSSGSTPASSTPALGALEWARRPRRRARGGSRQRPPQARRSRPSWRRSRRPPAGCADPSGRR